MRILKWIPLLYSILIFGQEDSILQIDPKIEADSLWYKNSQNNFSSSDEFILLGHQNFEALLWETSDLFLFHSGGSLVAP